MPPLSTRSMKSTLIVMRSIWLSAPVSWLLFWSMLTFLKPEASARPAWLFPAIIALCVLNVGLIFFFSNRPLDAATSETLATSYAQVSLVAWALTDAAILFGFVGFFVGGGMTAYLIALPFGIAGLVLMMPTSANVRRFQERIRATGSPLSLLDALAHPYRRPTPKRKG
jgi:hypothetical protein